MSRIDDLIAKYCPNGVEYKKLYEITFWDRNFKGTDKIIQPEIVTFKHVTAEYLRNIQQCPNGTITLLSTGNFSGKTDLSVVEDETIVNTGEILSIPSGGSATIKYYQGDFIDSGNILAVSSDVKLYSLKYIYHYLLEKKDIVSKFFRGAGIKHPSMLDILQLSLPVPPLPVQEEIVKILDSFTELEVELEAELEARKKQYEYYRGELLSFSDETAESFWKPLGDVCEVTDYVANGSFADLRKNVVYKREPSFAVLIRLADFSNGFDENNFIFIDEHAYEFLSKTKLYGGEIIMSNIGSIGSLFKCPKLKYKMSLAPNTIMVKTPNNDFYYHYFQSKKFQSDLIKITSKSAMPKFNKTDLKKLLIPVPSKPEQERIIAILDKFDALVNDISVGLPAEIAARRKQYECWRNKLLTFPEGACDA